MEGTSRLLGLAWRCHWRFDRPASLLPRAKTAADMGDRLEPHLLRRLSGERRAQSGGAKEHKLLVLRKNRFVVRALRVDPEFQHSARTVKGAWHPPVALQLADVANIYQHGVVPPRQLHGVLNGQRFDFLFRR